MYGHGFKIESKEQLDLSYDLIESMGLFDGLPVFNITKQAN